MRPEKQLKTFKIKLFVKRKSDSVIEEDAWNGYYTSSLNHYDICLRITFVLSFYVVFIQKKKCRPRLVRNSFFVHFIGSVKRTRWSLQQNRRSVQPIPGGVQPTGECPTKLSKCPTNAMGCPTKSVKRSTNRKECSTKL